MAMDITERKRAEEALRASEEVDRISPRLQVVLLAAHKMFLYRSPSCECITGDRPKQVPAILSTPPEDPSILRRP